MHFCTDELVAIGAALTAGPVLMYRYCRHQLGCFCRWCARLVKR